MKSPTVLNLKDYKNLLALRARDVLSGVAEKSRVSEIQLKKLVATELFRNVQSNQSD